MKISRWTAGAVCAGATLLGFVVAEAQQFAPRAQVQSGLQGGRVQAGAYPPGQSYNPGVQAQPSVQAQPGATYSRGTTVRAGRAQWPEQAASMDADIVAHLALGNAEEIALSRLGAQRAESDEVRDFAEMMVQEHSDFLGRLNRVQPQIVAEFGRLSGSRTASYDNEGYERRTTRRIGADEGVNRRDGERFDEDGDVRGSQRGSSRAETDDAEGDFRRGRAETQSTDRTGADRTGTQRTGSGRVGNSVDQPTGGDEDRGATGADNNQTGTAGPSGTGAASTGGVGTRTGEGRAPTSGENLGGASGIGTGTSGTSGSTNGSTGTGSGGTGAGAGAGGAGAGSGGTGAGGTGGGTGGSGGSGASLLPSMKSYPVVFQAGSQDENEDVQVPNRRRSGDVEDEGTTIGPNQTGPRGGYNQESTTQDNAGRRSSRGGQRAYDEDDYRDTRRGTISPRSDSRYGEADDYSRRGATAGQPQRGYDEDYRDNRGPTSPDRYSESYSYDPRRAGAGQAQRGQQTTSVQAPHLQLQREVTERCLANARRELEDKEGAEFDMAFMGMQIVAHNRILATLEASREHASPQLARLIDDGIRTTEEHLDHAREVVENLQRDQNRSASRQRNDRE